jgi:hypothetical protein
MIAVILGASRFDQRSGLDTPIALDRGPWCRECAGILNTHIHLQRPGLIDEAEVLDDVELFGVRGLVVVHICVSRQTPS